MNDKRPVIDIEPAKKRGIPKDELDKLLVKWQDKLLLSDWDLSVRIVDFQRDDYRQSHLISYLAGSSRSKCSWRYNRKLWI